MLSVLVLALVAGCAGQDLKKAYSQRRTVAPEPGSGASGPVPTGPINEPSVAIAALRQLDPCALITKDALSELGSAADPHSGLAIDECSSTVTDPGGKPISVRVKLGDSIIGGTDSAASGIEGLPIIENTHDKKSCFVTAVTSKDPALGITAQIGYEGGQPCTAGRKVLAKVLQKIKSGAPKLPVAKGSLVTAEACQLADGKVVHELSGAQDKLVTGLHGCSWSGTSGKGSLRLDLRFTYPPQEEKGAKRLDLGGGVKAWAKSRSENIAQCMVTWKHRLMKKDLAEVVNVEYANYVGDEKPADACRKAEKLAKTVVPKLPKP